MHDLRVKNTYLDLLSEQDVGLVAEVDARPPRLSPDLAFYLGPDSLAYEPDPANSLAAHAQRRGQKPVETFIDTGTSLPSCRARIAS